MENLFLVNKLNIDCLFRVWNCFNFFNFIFRFPTGTNPIVRFRLNSASNSNKLVGAEREFSVWVGDLSSEVDDYNLYRVFSNKYSSIKTAKVILDSSGFSKGYGFVRFGIEEEQKSALYEMNGYIGLGSKALKICNAVPKPKTTNASTTGKSCSHWSCEMKFLFNSINRFVDTTSTLPSYTTASNTITATDFSQYYDPSTYWQTTWPGYEPAVSTPTDYASYYQQQASAHIQQQAIQQQNATVHQNEDLALVEYKITDVDQMVDQMNREVIDRDRNFYDALESSKWMPIEQLETF